MNKEQAKEKIKKLVERYQALSEAEKKKYNEQQTKDHFIRPLFEALGWDFEHDVWPETDVSGKRVDYAVKLNSNNKFFIEAKAISVNLDEEQWAEQAINYSWHKSVPWVILTDFEAIKIYNTEWDEPNIQSCQFFEIAYDKYLIDERLWWLSREAFEKGILDKKAEELGRKPKRVIDKQLASDLVKWRNLLFDNLLAYNKNKIEERKISEYVQRILDRLIFIRTLEDRKIEDIILQPLARNWQEKGKANELLKEINKIFRKVDKIYNSGLFEEAAYDHLGEMIDAEDQVFVEIIEELYKTKGRGIRYNFADIPADIFGSIYEQYLGHIQKEDGKEKKTSKRKSQGIYYTPRYIVDYIVRNTLGEIVKEKKPEEIKNLKILDSACGSGSFLISAYQTLIDYWQKHNFGKATESQNEKFKKIAEEFKKRKNIELSAPEKMRILLNNIRGVDLDEEAVEIARLNLLLKMVGQRGKLPKLESNICVGNSLISGTPKELEKYFGKDWKARKPFNWQEKFSEVFKQGGFDVIIGNPPYVNLANIKDASEREYLKSEFETAKNKSDLYSFFTEKATKLLKNNGVLGFIFSNSWLGTDSFSKFREYLVKNTIVYQMVRLSLGVFEDATVTPVLIFLRKGKADKNHKIKIFELKKEKIERLPYDLSYKRIAESPNFNFSFNPEIKIKIPTTNLGEIGKLSLGIKTSDDDKFILNKKENDDCYKLLRGKDVIRYNYQWARKWLWYRPDLMMKKIGAGPRKLEYFLKDKILFRSISGGKVMASFDSTNFLTNDKVHILYYVNKFSLKFILGVVNSKLIDFWIKATFNNLLEIKINQLENIPIPELDFSNKKEKAKHDELANLADKMLALNKEIQKFDPTLYKEEYEEKKKEIEKTDQEIDQKVYELYGLTAKEIKIVEGE